MHSDTYSSKINVQNCKKKKGGKLKQNTKSVREKQILMNLHTLQRCKKLKQNRSMNIKNRA